MAALSGVGHPVLNAVHPQLPRAPVLRGFHPDPSICRVGRTFYLACSSFEYAPGIPLYRSDDLVSWAPLGHALDTPAHVHLDGAAPSEGIYAPTLRHHDGLFWIIATNVGHRAGQFVVSAEDPAGPWSDPVWVPGAIGIDPDLAWDDDGTCYLTWSHRDASGAATIEQVELDIHTGETSERRRQLWQGAGGKDPEGPHLHRHGDFWYLVLAEGGTERGHAVTVARAEAPTGPFTPDPDNPVLTARGRSSPVQSVGHADLVERPDGGWVIAFLGTRPRGATPQWHVLGRETFLAELAWEDGWPRVSRPIEPTQSVAMSNDLEGRTLTDVWQSPTGFPTHLMRRVADGWRLHSVASQRTFVGRRQQHFCVRVQATMTVMGVGGLEVRIDPDHAVSLEQADGQVRLVARVGKLVTTLGQTPGAPRVVLELRVAAAADDAPLGLHAGPDVIVAGAAGEGGFQELGRLDGRYLSSEVAGGFTGRFIGPWCAAGHVVVNNFSYTGSDDGDAIRAAVPDFGRSPA